MLIKLQMPRRSRRPTFSVTLQVLFFKFLFSCCFIFSLVSFLPPLPLSVLLYLLVISNPLPPHFPLTSLLSSNYLVDPQSSLSFSFHLFFPLTLPFIWPLLNPVSPLSSLHYPLGRQSITSPSPLLGIICGMSVCLCWCLPPSPSIWASMFWVITI